MVSSLPIPVPSPGLKRVPRWRTMISPPVTVWPAKTFTPRRLAFESRPLREEPSPFLCAIACLLGSLLGSTGARGLRLVGGGGLLRRRRLLRRRAGLRRSARLLRRRRPRLWLGRRLRLGHRLRRLMSRRGAFSRHGRGRLCLRSRLGRAAGPAAAAHLDPHDLDAGQLLAVARASLVAALGL